MHLKLSRAEMAKAGSDPEDSHQRTAIMISSLEPSFDTLVRRHIGTTLRARRFKRVRNRVYERVVGSWTQRVEVYRFRQGPGFALELEIFPHDVVGCLYGRHSEHGSRRYAPLSSVFIEAEEECSSRLLPFLDELAAADSVLESLTAECLEQGDSSFERFDGGSLQCLLFANVRWRDRRPQEAKEFAERVVRRNDINNARARFIKSQIDAGQPYTRG